MRKSSSASSVSAAPARLKVMVQLEPRKSYRCRTSFIAWFTALSTSWRSAPVEMSKEALEAMENYTYLSTTTQAAKPPSRSIRGCSPKAATMSRSSSGVWKRLRMRASFSASATSFTAKRV